MIGAFNVNGYAFGGSERPLGFPAFGRVAGCTTDGSARCAIAARQIPSGAPVKTLRLVPRSSIISR
jgi:hypothetical protein